MTATEPGKARMTRMAPDDPHATGLRLADPTLLRDRCLIGGAWTGVPRLSVRDPASGIAIGAVPDLGAVEAQAAVEAARSAFPAWSGLTAETRAAVLRRWQQAISTHKADLAQILTREQGKPLAEALGEVEYAASFVGFYAEEGRRLYGETIPAPRADARILVLRQPVGVAAAITPWNFPAAMVTRKVAPAMAVGCAVVLKPAPETPLTALALAALAERAGVPPGVFNVVTGDAGAIGRVLTEHPAVRTVSFTGSTEVGKLLMRQAASTVKKLALELGGNAPFIVFDDADLEAAADGCLESKFRNAGQTCVCANRIYVHEPVYAPFLARLLARTAALKVGRGLEPGVQIGPLISEAAVAKVERHIADAVAKGAQVRLGGGRHALGGRFFSPTVLSDMTADMAISREETFGPVAAVYRVRDEADALAQANATPYGLAAYVYARDLGRVVRMAEGLETGMVGVNAAKLGADVAPFGGVKQSGLGREGSRHGLEEFTELKYVLLGGLAS